MLTEGQIEEVIDYQNSQVKKKKPGVNREKLSQIQLVPNFACIITGVRRCGKSTLMQQMLKEKLDNVLFLNFEDPRLAGFDVADFGRLTRLIENKEHKILFFDEIQIVQGWEFFVRQLLDNDLQVVITGSNASLLSQELGTKLTGRHLSYELFPFSYHEFLTLTEKEKNQESLDLYIQNGGFPEFIKTDNAMILNQLLDDILYRDIAVRFAVRDVTSLRRLAVYLISNIGKPVSGNKLKELFDIKATSTILEYFSYLEDAYVVQFLPRFSFSLKVQIRNPKKVYAIDLGMFTQTSIVFTEEKGRRLENLVYLQLRRKYKELYYFQEKKECDFVVFEKGLIKEALQVCYFIDDLNMKREFEGLGEALDFFKLKQGRIITYNQKDSFDYEGKTIELVPLAEFIE